MIYVDTSVLAAYYCPEPLSRQAQELLRKEAKPALSYLAEVELISAVARKVRTKELNDTDGNRILMKFSSHVNAGLFHVIPVERHHWQMAKDWIGFFKTSLRTLDALHLALASDHGLQLVTSDKSFFQAAGKFDVDARLIVPGKK